MPRLPDRLDGARRPLVVRGRPLACALVMLVVFLSTVIVLGVQAGTGTAMLTTVVAIVAATVACGVWGAAMAVKETQAHLPSALTGELAEHVPSRSR